jgi:ABC-type glycerol-3-phosphate transport system substrate-binding protein
MKHLLAVLALTVLAACAAPLVAPAPTDRVTVPASLPGGPPPADLRARAQAFITVLERIEPMAEAE